MFVKSLLYLVSITETFGDIHQISWSQVLVDKSDVTFKEKLQVTAVEAANTCAKTDDCALVCEVEDGYGLSQQKIGAEYFEGSSGGNQYSCWTKMPLDVTPEKLSEDGLYYHRQLRSIKLTGDQCVNACRRIPGYRSAILRTKEQFAAVYSKYYIHGDWAYLVYVGLIRNLDDGSVGYDQFKWIDGTPYETGLAIGSPQNVKHIILWSNRFDDWDSAALCLCQGNPDLVEW